MNSEDVTISKLEENLINRKIHKSINCVENVLKIEEEAKIANQKVLTTKILGVLR